MTSELKIVEGVVGSRGAGRGLVMTESEFVSAPAKTNLKALT
jgi:hypothetical protein